MAQYTNGTVVVEAELWCGPGDNRWEVEQVAGDLELDEGRLGSLVFPDGQVLKVGDWIVNEGGTVTARKATDFLALFKPA